MALNCKSWQGRWQRGSVVFVSSSIADRVTVIRAVEVTL